MHNTDNQKKLYFGPLDTLRTCAFCIVFISHAYFSFFAHTELRTKLFAHGEIGVQMFFVLSAFLITYLSLSEYYKTGAFSIVYFFKKRILRIWPVYFFVIGISYMWYLYDGSGSFGCMYSFFYFLGNMCMVEGLPAVQGSKLIGPMWSVSVEQQFYVVFPLVLYAYVVYMKRSTTKTCIHTHMVKIIYALLGSIFAYTLYARYVYAQDWNYISYATVLSLPGFISGIYIAYAMHKQHAWIAHVQKYARVYSVTAYAAVFLSLYIKFLGSAGVSLYILPIIYATYIYIVTSTVSSEKSSEKNSFSLQQVTRYLGKISYGLYAYHMIAIILVYALFPGVVGVLGSLLALAITVLGAHVSYRYIESWFLKFK